MIQSDCTWTLRVHGHQLDQSICSDLAVVPETLDPESFLAFLLLVTNLNVCIGNPDGQFVALVQERKNEVKSSDGSSKSAYIDDFASVCCDGQSYPVTVRTSNCEILSSGRKCQHCKDYRATLRTLSNRLIKLSARSSVSCSIHTNNRYVCFN